MIKNKCTYIPLTHVHNDKLNTHIEIMNNSGWELMSVAVQMVNIDEHFIMFWRKNVPDPVPTVTVTS